VKALEDVYFRIYGDYGRPARVFYGRDECPWLETVEQQWRTIRDEFESYFYRRRAHLGASYVPDDVEVRGWRSINFMTYGHRWHRNRQHFPRTVALLDGIPHVTGAFVNLLEARSVLPVHNGDTNTTYRCHLGLIVPPGDVAAGGLDLGGVRRGWRDRDFLL
jgi:aspartyl/asparaginyl beta-hydroxylase (cupin superfamily)